LAIAADVLFADNTKALIVQPGNINTNLRALVVRDQNYPSKKIGYKRCASAPMGLEVDYQK